MPNVAGPFGLRPVYKLGGVPYNGATIPLTQTVNQTTPMYVGSIVALVAGQPVQPTATATTTRSANQPIGVCMGVEYTDPTYGKHCWSQYLPANAVTAGYTDIVIHVADDPDLVFKVQADGNTNLNSRAKVGYNAEFQTFTGSATTGLSATTLKCSTVATTATLALRIVDIEDTDGTYPNVYVTWNAGIHSYRCSEGG